MDKHKCHLRALSIGGHLYSTRLNRLLCFGCVLRDGRGDHYSLPPRYFTVPPFGIAATKMVKLGPEYSGG